MLIKNIYFMCFQNYFLLGFPGGAVVENLPANAGDTGSRPGLGGSHMPRSNQAREPQLLSLRVWSLCSATREATTVRGPRTAMSSGPRLPQLQKVLAQKQRPNIVINQSINLKKKKKECFFLRSSSLKKMQGTRVQSLVREDPTCYGATKPVSHNY